MRKRVALFVLLLSCAGFCLYGCGGSKAAQREAIKAELVQQMAVGDEVLKVTFFDVGKGDAILVDIGGETMLIDSGFDETSEQLIVELKSREIEALNYLVITHFDKDHVGGADKILDAMDVECVLQPDYAAGGKQYKEYKKALKQKGLTPELITDITTLELGEVRLLIYPPQQKAYELDDNDWSLVVSLRYGEQSFLFTGDCEEVRLQELLDQEDFSLKHSVLKAPHHGIETQNTKEFLETVLPEVTVITCSNEWKTRAVQKVLDTLGTDVYATSRGTVTCVTDGRVLFVDQ